MPTKLQNHQQLNSEKHKFRLRMKPISNSFVGISKAHSLRVFAPLGIFACSVLGTLSASALSISVPQSISFDIISGKASHSGTATIEILSDDALAGYTLTLSGSETLNASKTENGSLNKIANENWTDENNFDDNTWGLKYCTKLNDADDCITSTSYTKPAEALQIDKTAVNNSQPVKYALSIGAKTSESINADTYSSIFTLAATPNPVFRFVGFADWAEGLPDTITGEGLTVNIPSQEPTKTGYKFAGWCPVKPINNGTTCPQTLIQKDTGNYALTTTNGVAYAQLYATWTPTTTFADAFRIFKKTPIEIDGVSYYKMQDMTPGICSAVSITGEASVSQLIDTRGNTIYSVGKMIDGKCWLLDNLRLTRADGDLTSANTNVPSDWEGFGFEDEPYKLPPSGTSCFANEVCSNNGMGNGTTETQYTGYTVPAVNESNIDYVNANDEIAAASNWKGGVYYNYAAASAGTVRMARGTNNKDAEYDICPKGWRMPTGGLDSEYQGIYTALGGKYWPRNDENGETLKEKDGGVWWGPEARIELRNLLHLPSAGEFSNNSASDVGSSGCFWASTRYSGYGMYELSFSANHVLPQRAHDRFHGISVRCVAK